MARFSFVQATVDFTDPGALLDTWVELYLVPGGSDALLFSGHISNADTSNQATHPIWMAAGVGAAPTRILLTEIPVPYGASLNPGKALFMTGESIFVKSSTAYMVFNFNIMLKAI
jgi:hypothetical protein